MIHPTQNLNKTIIALFSGQTNTISIPRFYIQLTGGYTRGNILNQCIFYSNKSTLKDGWFWKCYSEWYEETGIPERTMRRILTEFENEGWIETKVKKNNGFNVKQIRPNIDKVIDSIGQLDCFKENQIDRKLPQPATLTGLEIPVQELPQPATMAVSEPAKMADYVGSIPLYTDNNKTDNKTFVDSSNPTHMEIPFSSKKKKPKKDYRDDPRFMQFYSAYPKKENPNDAYKAFNALSPDDDLLEKIVTDVGLRIAEHSQWKDKKYIPQPAAYLRKATFDGEIFNEEAEKKKKLDLQKLESEKRLAEQERFSRQEREYQIKKDEQNNQNSLAWRKYGGEIKRGATISPTAHKHLDQILNGLRR